MMKKSFAFSIALHVSIAAGMLFWMLHYKEPQKPKVVPVTIITVVQPQKPQPPQPKVEQKEPPKPIEKPVVVPMPNVITKPVTKPTEQVVPKALPKPVEQPIVKQQEAVKEQAKVEQKVEPRVEQKIVQKQAPQAPTVDTKKVQNAYLAYVRQNAEKLKTYPKNAKRLSQTGVAYVHFIILADGTITQISLQKSSGFALLDDAAVKIITALAKVKPIPKELNQEKYDILLPIDYSLE